MTSTVMNRLELLAGAPDGVGLMRSLIVELAVSGQLVPQVSADEPASALAARLAAAKVLALTDVSRRSKPLERPAMPIWPFEIPKSWSWHYLDDLVLITGGVTLGRKLAGREVVSLPYLRVANVQRGYLTLDEIKAIELPAGEVAKFALQHGDLLITEGGDWDKVGRTAIWRDEIAQCVHQNHVFRARACSDEFLPRWAELYLNSPVARSYFAGSSKQTTNLASINMTQLRSCAFPVPPLAEQHRIVAKVDELMALCDRLEARQQDAEAAHAQMVQALLDSLTQARDAEEFQACWQRLSPEFANVFCTDSSVDALKRALRQLAFTGALTKRGTHDWTHGRVGEAVDFLNGYAFKSEWFVPNGVRLLRNVNISPGEIHWREAACISSDRQEEFASFALRDGDVVLSLDRPIISTGLKVAVVEKQDLPCLLLQRVARLSPRAEVVRPAFLLNWLRSPLFVDVIDPGRSNGVPHISTKQVANMSIPLPALEEQDRVVATLDELLTLCDQLKARMTAARAKHAQLAQALVEHAVV